jgi:hypothetical protein
MRIRHSLALFLAVAALATGCGEKATPDAWEPDEALRRADETLQKSDVAVTVTVKGTGFLAAGLEKTFDTVGERPYRFDIACDSEESPRISLVLSRDGAAHDRTVDVSCTAGESVRLNIPVGEPLSVHVQGAPKDESAPVGVIAWQLATIDPRDIKGCADDLAGCAG